MNILVSYRVKWIRFLRMRMYGSRQERLRNGMTVIISVILMCIVHGM